MKKYGYLLLLMLCSNLAQAQEFEMATGMRANGQIYVVVAIILIVLFGLIGFLFALDRKITKLENKLNNKK